MADLNVTIDFLIAPASNADRGGTIQSLEADFGAVVTPGLQLAFDERVHVELSGHTLHGEAARRTIPVCGTAAFVLLKALAFGDRAEPKDAYDLTYVLQHSPDGITAIGQRLRRHHANHPDVVSEAVRSLKRDFATPESLGPSRAAEFQEGTDDQRDVDAADTHGYVDDLLKAANLD